MEEKCNNVNGLKDAISVSWRQMCIKLLTIILQWFGTKI